MKLRYFTPALLWMILIFYMSSQVGNDSAGMSDMIVSFIQSLIHDITTVEVSINTLSFIIRKSAHVIEYMILTFFFLYAFYKNKYNKYLLYSASLSVLYAMSDELHQTFIPGRSGTAVDVGIDTIGVVLALLIFLAIKKFYSKRKTA